MTFRTRYDAWLVGFLSLSLGGSIVLVAVVVPDLASALVVLVPTVAMALFVIWVADTRYTFDRDVLVVRSGPFRWRVPLAQVVRVTDTRNPMGSPAWSLQRLAIEFQAKERTRRLMVSPKDRAGFLAALREKCPGASLP